MVGIALVLAAPFGILSAIYINEYDPYSPLSNAVRFVAKLIDRHSLDHLRCVCLCGRSC